MHAPWTAACQASLSFTISWSLLKLTSIESLMQSNHLILCHPLLLLPSIFPSIRVFSSGSSHQVAKVLEFQLESVQFNSVQLLSHVQLFTTPWTVAHQASLSITNPQSLLKLMSTESVIPFNHLILCHLLLLLRFPASGSFQMSQLFASGGQSIG